MYSVKARTWDIIWVMWVRFVDRAWRNPDELRRERSVDCHFYGLNTKWILIHSLWVSTCAKTRTQEQVYMHSHTWNVWNNACQHWYQKRRQFISSLASRERDKREREREREGSSFMFSLGVAKTRDLTTVLRSSSQHAQLNPCC